MVYSFGNSANARQRVTLISAVWKGRKMCFTLRIFRNLKMILVWN